MHACTTNNKCYCACSIYIGADVALGAVISIQSLRKTTYKFWKFVQMYDTVCPDIPL